MQCEVCGKYIERGKWVRLEGGVVMTCEECTSYGEVVKIEVLRPVKKVSRGQEKIPDEDIEIKFECEIDENYAQLIRNKRMRLNLKQDELARRINEPTSVIQRIEAGRMEPTIDMALRLGKLLKIPLVKKQRIRNLNKKWVKGKSQLLEISLLLRKKENLCD